MAPANNYVQDVMARFDDFVGPGVQWQRTLWGVGLAFALREVIEISDGVQNGALSPKALKRHTDAVTKQVAEDPAAGEESPRSRLKVLLTRDLSSGGTNYNELIHWIQDIEEHGLTRWGSCLLSGDKPSRERVARALACELFRHDFSAAYLRDWMRDLRTSRDQVDEDALVQAAQEVIAISPQTFDVLLPFERPPESRIARPTQWRDPSDVSQWLIANGFERQRQHGGLLLEIRARDPYSAGQQAADLAHRLAARAAVGTRGRLRFLSDVYVAGHPRAISLSRSRRAEVRALERERKLLDLEASDTVDQALELMSHLNTSAAPVAAVGGWSAVESLLSGPGDEDKVITAERLANLVACSWPRAELTTIAWARVYQAEDTPDQLSQEIAGYATNRERANRVLSAIAADDDLQLARPAEQLALRRMQKLVRSPRRELLAVRELAGDALRRLYRQRNLVVHGGQTAGFGLSAALRTAAPLVGAGLDRITHASLVARMRPLEIAARAQVEIERAGTQTAPLLTDMLE